MKLMIDTGANKSFISMKVLKFTQEKQFVNRKYRRAYLADDSTSIAVYGEMKLNISLGEMQTSISAAVVGELCADCILGLDFINKYKLIINAGEQTVSIKDNDKQVTLKINGNDNDVRFPARLINHIRIPPKNTVSVPVSVRFSSANVSFCPSFRLQQRTSLCMLNSMLAINDHTSFISIHNPTTRPHTLSRGIILGTTTIPTLSFKKKAAINEELVNKNVDDLIEHIVDQQQRRTVKNILVQHAKLLDTSKPSIATTVKPHEIKTLDHPPPTSKPYYSTPNKQEEMYKITEELLHSGLIRPSYSPYAAPALLVPKQDRSWRMVVDYKKLNDMTIKDNHPLPNMEQAIQVLGGQYKFFSKLDMKSGFWQIPIKEEDKHKTAFITPEGLYEWNVLAQGLKNSPPSFQRVMMDILSPCRQFSLVYIDDIVVFSRSFEEHLNHVQQILSILWKNNFQLNPKKCSVFRRQIDYLSHTISQYGVKPNDEKIQAIVKLQEPTKLTEANKFLGSLSWYRKFIPQFATIAAPIHRVTNLTKSNRHKFSWGEPQRQAFLQLKQLLITAPLFLDFPDDNYPVILTTDASKMGIGGTLQQIINGETKNLYYHSQMTSSTQRRYDPIELEALAIWLCFQRMRSYLLGRSIIIYTDHCPLCNMMTSSVKNRRVDRISILLQEYNIEKIIHIKGEHNCLADYLSRHPIQIEEEIFQEDYGIGALLEREPPTLVSSPAEDVPVMNAVVTRSKARQLIQQQDQPKTTEPPSGIDLSLQGRSQELDDPGDSSWPTITSNSFNATEIKLEQAKDPDIQRKISEVKQDPFKHPYVLKDGLLYRLAVAHDGCVTKMKVIYLPSSMVESLLRAYHDDPISGHFGVQRTYLKIKNKYWWPKMKETIIQYVGSCLPCQQHNIQRSKRPGQLFPIESPMGPFQFIGIDYCGPFKQTPRGNKYVLCITDYFTRWVTAIALPDCSAQTTAVAFFNGYICQYGVPLSILTDQGTHFRNNLMDSLAKLIGYNHIFSTVYHPQSNGMVERFNATFVPQLAKLQDRVNNNWDEFLSPVVFAYNTGNHATTNYSPFQLQFGCEPRLPTDEPNDSFTFPTPNDYYGQLKKSLGMMHDKAHNNIGNRQQQYKTHYDKRRPDPNYDIDDLVLIRIHGKRTKLEPKFSIIPKRIIQKQHPNYWVKDEETQVVSKVHVNDVRPIFTFKST